MLYPKHRGKACATSKKSSSTARPPGPAWMWASKRYATGTSKGKGFAGTVKRHNFNTSKKTHGGNGNVRKPGSIGSMYPQKVFKGKRMAGQMGAEQVTVSGLKVAFVDVENNLIGFKGAIPGPKKSLVTVVGA